MAEHEIPFWLVLSFLLGVFLLSLVIVLTVWKVGAVCINAAKKATRELPDQAARKTIGTTGRFINYLKRIYKEETEHPSVQIIQPEWETGRKNRAVLLKKLTDTLRVMEDRGAKGEEADLMAFCAVFRECVDSHDPQVY